MYQDRSSKKWKIVIAIAAILICAALVWIFIASSPAAKSKKDSAEAIRRAVQQSALQCYVVEGAYPPSLEYLQENYGLRVNTTDYYITYEAYAENQLPDVRVTVREH